MERRWALVALTGLMLSLAAVTAQGPAPAGDRVALDGLHANTQIPKILGAAREYELTGESRYRDIATFFWERVATHRSYATGDQSGVDVDRLAWLSGCWTQPRTNGLVEEQWMAPRGGSMLGMSRTVIGGTTVEYEFLRIAVVGNRLAYVAKPSGQPEATFAMKSIDDGMVVFENLAHDFPQRIIYRRNADATVTARIEGAVKGEARGRDFPYRRCSP